MLAACDDLLGMPAARRRPCRYMHPGRVDVIGAGALIWRAVVARVAQAAGVGSVVVSEYDILDGIVLGLAGPGRPAMGYGLGVVVDPESPL